MNSMRTLREAIIRRWTGEFSKLKGGKVGNPYHDRAES